MIGSLPTIENELDELERFIQKYTAQLNTEGMWLFLATLGCWSVTFPPLQLVSFGIAGVLFGERFSNRLDEKRSFRQLIETIETRIAKSEHQKDTKKARLYDLAKLNEDQLSLRNSFKRSNVFLLCWVNFVCGIAYATIQFAFKFAG